MKKILITGAGSYIGTSFIKWVKENHLGEFEVEELDMIDGTWRETSFSGYDAVFHVAGIAHQKETRENAHLYYEVNRDLAIAVARKAKDEGISYFILLSSMSVYGKNTGVIGKQDCPDPKSNYGKSKYEADLAIEKMVDSNFQVAILRPPMVYGDGCKGNYQTLRKFALHSPVFPEYKNQRSMVRVDVLCEYLVKLIKQRKSGLFFPQNKQYVCTTDMIKKIARQSGKHIVTTRIFNPFIRLALILRIPVFQKVFGDLIYEK